MRHLRWEGIVVALAVAARVAAVLVLQSHTVPRSTYEHGEIAANLLAGKGFSIAFLGADGPTSQQAPVYPLIVAGAYAAGGVEQPRALLLLQLGQAVLGGVLAARVMALAREVAPGRRGVALAAGLAAAVHPTLVYAATHVQVALLAATLLAWTLAWGFRAGRLGTGRSGVIVGLLLGLSMLTDPILALLGPSVALTIGRRARVLALAAGTAVLVLVPWTVRNALVHGELVFVKSTFGYAFWQGNCALSEGTDKVRRASVERVLAGGGGGLRGLNESLWKARHEAGYLDDIALTRADYAELGRLTEPERSRRLMRRALDELRAEPGRYARLCLRRLRYFLLFDETNPKTRNALYRASHLGLTLFGVAGLVLMPGAIRRRLAPTVLAFVLITAFHALTIVSARFHIPLEPLLGLWGAGALARLGDVRAGSRLEIARFLRWRAREGIADGAERSAGLGGGLARSRPGLLSRRDQPRRLTTS